jgi:hypothetical protein
MTRKAVLAVFLFCLSAIMAAQETPKFDLFGGYSFGRLKTPDDLSPANLNGWDSSLTWNLNSWLGIDAEGGGHYGSSLNRSQIIVFLCTPTGCVQPNPVPPITTDQRFHTYAIGPRLTWRNGHVVTPFAHVLFGGLHATSLVDGGFFQFTEHADSFLVKTGGGFDLRLNSRASWRTQIDWLTYKINAGRKDSFAVTTGPVFHFGSK